MDRFTNTHFGTAAAVYGARPQDVLKRIKAIGFTGIRDNSGVTGINLAKSAGLKVISVCGNGDLAAKAIAAGADYIEGPNEFNAPGMRPPDVTDWMTELRNRWNGIVAAKKAANSNVLLIAPSFSLGNAAQAIADAKTIGAFPEADFGNLHCYMASQDAATWKPRLVNAMQIPAALAPGKPIWLTEHGTWWCDDATIRASSTHLPTDPARAAELWPEWTRLVESLGFVGSAIYEFADEVQNQTAAKKQEGWFGVVDKDLNDKPQTQVISSLVDSAATINRLQATVAAQQGTITALQSQNASLSTQLAQVSSDHAAMAAEIAAARTAFNKLFL